MLSSFVGIILVIALKLECPYPRRKFVKAFIGNRI